MTKRIFNNIICVAAVVLVASFALFFGVLYKYFSGEQAKFLQNNLAFTTSAVEEYGYDYLKKLPALETRITLIDTDGSVLFDNKSDSRLMENHKDRKEVKAAKENGRGESFRYSATLMEETEYYANHLKDGKVLRVSATRLTPFALILSMIQPIGIVLVIAGACSIALARKLAKNLVEPLTKINFDKPLESDTYDEIAPVLKRLEEQRKKILSQADYLAKERIQFTANVTHELKTPLQSIMGSAELLQHNYVKAEDVPTFLERIHSEAVRLLTLINNIISLSHLDEKEKYKFECLDLFELVDEEIVALYPLSEKHKVLLTASGRHCLIFGVRELLHEVIYNLCENAIKYNVENGRVDINVYQEDGKTYLKVKDTGIGIPEEHQPRIFERFYRVDKSRSKETGGTGLGLSIVKHAAQYMNGSIDLKSKVGEGTEITIAFDTENI